eukprot:494021_1
MYNVLLVVLVVISTSYSFSFTGTYRVSIQGELRRLSVCTSKNGQIYWGLAKLLADIQTEPNPLINYVYAVGRDEDGMEVIYDDYNDIYEAEGMSFWFKESGLGIQEIKFFLRYNPNNEHYGDYTLSIAKNHDKYDYLIDNIFILNKISDEVKGECMEPAMDGASWDTISYPSQWRSQRIDDSGFCPTDNGLSGECVEYQRWETLNGESACYGLFDVNTNEFFSGGDDAVVPPIFKWENRLKIKIGAVPEPTCCPFTTSFYLLESKEQFLQSTKCETDNVGIIWRMRQVDNIPDTDNCPIFV